MPTRSSQLESVCDFECYLSVVCLIASRRSTQVAVFWLCTKCFGLPLNWCPSTTTSPFVDEFLFLNRWMHLVNMNFCVWRLQQIWSFPLFVTVIHHVITNILYCMDLLTWPHVTADGHVSLVFSSYCTKVALTTDWEVFDPVPIFEAIISLQVHGYNLILFLLWSPLTILPQASAA